MLHSKLKNGLWPSVSLILEKIHFFLPRIPRVVIQLFKENHSYVARQGLEKDEKVNFNDFEVVL